MLTNCHVVGLNSYNLRASATFILTNCLCGSVTIHFVKGSKVFFQAFAWLSTDGFSGDPISLVHNSVLYYIINRMYMYYMYHNEQSSGNSMSGKGEQNTNQAACTTIITQN